MLDVISNLNANCQPIVENGTIFMRMRLFFSNIYYYLYLIDVNNVIWGNFWVPFNQHLSCNILYHVPNDIIMWNLLLSIYPVCVHTVYCSVYITSDFEI